MGMSFGTVNEIIHKDLKIKKLFKPKAFDFVEVYCRYKSKLQTVKNCTKNT